MKNCKACHLTISKLLLSIILVIEKLTSNTLWGSKKKKTDTLLRIMAMHTTCCARLTIASSTCHTTTLGPFVVGDSSTLELAMKESKSSLLLSLIHI